MSTEAKHARGPTPPDPQAGEPPRWKHFLMTWSVIYPLVLYVPQLMTPALRQLGLPVNAYLDTLFATVTIVFLMVYVIMPQYRRLLGGWLSR
ncbi:MAG: hypothetical protein IT486_03310 [Gammaproteobacteria bacterium]|nr:hypothetical protein [Gammaproteobacteria bacterium]